MTAYAIGIDIGGTNVKSVAITEDGTILREDHFGTADDAAARWIDAVCDHVAKVERELGSAAAVGVTSPGLAARDGCSIAWMQGRMDAVQGLDWTRRLRREKPVPVLNDAHAALLGEVWQGAARGQRDVVLLTLGTGVGGAIFCDGRLLKGHLGRAGHLGHTTVDFRAGPDITGCPGSIEDAIGECTLQKRGGGRYASTKALVEAVRAGDNSAQQIWTESVKALAASLASIINAVDPAVIILGGGIMKAGDTLMNPLLTFINDMEWRPMGTGVGIVAAQLGDRAGAFGAAWQAWQQTETPP